jgi:intron-binding protein aquarius
MPRPKRVKGASTKKAVKDEQNELAPEAPLPAKDSTPPGISPDSDNQWVGVAQKLWLKPKKSRAKSKGDVVKQEIWDVLEGESFRYPSLLALENVQALESYLWPGFNEDSSDYHVLLIVLLANVKRREQLATWCTSLT